MAVRLQSNCPSGWFRVAIGFLFAEEHAYKARQEEVGGGQAAHQAGNVRLVGWAVSIEGSVGSCTTATSRKLVTWYFVSDTATSVQQLGRTNKQGLLVASELVDRCSTTPALLSLLFGILILWVTIHVTSYDSPP